MKHDAAFSDFVAARQTHLRRIAYALCGDWHRADDLLQTALTKLYVAWPRIRHEGGEEAYVRQIMVRANIDEHYISRIFAGQQGAFSFNGKSYELAVKKVFTQVSNGQFQVDLAFRSQVPGGIRRGQSLQVRLALSDQTQAVLVPKGGFYQKTGGNWIFKVDAQGHKAYRTDIRLGRQNPEYYEVLEGLEPGDKVVTSGYENYEDMGELVIRDSGR